MALAHASCRPRHGGILHCKQPARWLWRTLATFKIKFIALGAPTLRPIATHIAPYHPTDRQAFSCNFFLEKLFTSCSQRKIYTRYWHCGITPVIVLTLEVAESGGILGTVSSLTRRLGISRVLRSEEHTSELQS